MIDEWYYFVQVYGDVVMDDLVVIDVELQFEIGEFQFLDEIVGEVEIVEEIVGDVVCIDWFDYDIDVVWCEEFCGLCY